MKKEDKVNAFSLQGILGVRSGCTDKKHRQEKKTGFPDFLLKWAMRWDTYHLSLSVQTLVASKSNPNSL